MSSRNVGFRPTMKTKGEIMSKVKVSKVKIEIDKKFIELSLDEAYKLQKILNDTFGRREIQIASSAPIIIERPVYPRPWRYTMNLSSAAVRSGYQYTTSCKAGLK